ncbi:MAG: hypothetical protein OXH69_18435 [Acidobacteria bacterium]|nr:hypothetical protein [Acidobacteriota bacterium]
MRRALVGLTIATAAWSTMATAQDDSHVSAIRSMEKFLEAWVVRNDMQSTLQYFGVSDAALKLIPMSISDQGNNEYLRGLQGKAADRRDLPREVMTGYANLLRVLWPYHIVDAVGLQDVLVTNQEVHRVLTDELPNVAILHDGGFIVFEATEPGEINTFNLGYGEVARVLQPTVEDPVLTMIADFKLRKELRLREELNNSMGPFVSFWRQEERAHPPTTGWYIQGLGAFPDY